MRFVRFDDWIYINADTVRRVVSVNGVTYIVFDAGDEVTVSCSIEEAIRILDGFHALTTDRQCATQGCDGLPIEYAGSDDLCAQCVMEEQR